MEYVDRKAQSFIMTPEQAKKQIETLGYSSWTNVPLGCSDYFDALVTIATSKQPLNFADVRDKVRGSMFGRSNNFSR